jgi:hypothetical protein
MFVASALNEETTAGNEALETKLLRIPQCHCNLQARALSKLKNKGPLIMGDFGLFRWLGTPQLLAGGNNYPRKVFWFLHYHGPVSRLPHCAVVPIIHVEEPVANASVLIERYSRR